MNYLWQDLRYAARMLMKRPCFTLIAVFTLALGIGANTAVFSVVNAVLFRVLPYEKPDRLVQIFQNFRPQRNMDTMPVAPANFIDWQIGNQSFEGLAAYRMSNFNLSGENNPEYVHAAEASANLFSVLGVEPILGRAFQAGEDSPGSEPVVILSHSLWQRRFGGDQSITGRTVKANNKQFTVIGVMPQDFRFPTFLGSADVEIWSPLVFAPGEKNNREAINLLVIARLKPDIGLEQARTAMNGLMSRLEQAHPLTNKNWGVNLTPLADLGISHYRALFFFLTSAVGLVQLIACANVANLLLARGLERQKELTIRAALGAGRLRIIRQLLTEGLLLSLLGCLLGVGLAMWGIDLLAVLAPVTNLPELKHASLNGRVLAFSLALSVLTGFLFSLFPALTLSNFSLREGLQEGARAVSDSLQRARLRLALVVVELALSLVLLLCAGLVIGNFYVYMNVEPGYVATNAMTMRMALPAEKHKDSQQWTAFFERAEEEVKSVPGVVAAAMGSGAPMEMFGQARRYHVAGNSAPGDKAIGAEYFSVSPDYFRATGIALRQGRYFNSADDGGAPRVAMVNETFVKREFPDKNPLGERIVLLGDVNASVRDPSSSEVLEIVGVVADTKEYRLYVEAPAIIYAPLRQSPQDAMSLVIKGAGDPTLLLPEIRQRLLKLDPDQPIYNVKTLEQIIGEHHTLFRFNTFLLTVFAAIGLALSLIGLYAVIAYSVSQRIKEFGIRIALGAQPQDIFKLVIGKCALLSATGMSLGLAASFPALKLLGCTLKESMNLDLVGNGPVLFIVVCGSMTVVALLASWLPARRAMKVDPMVALRVE